MFYCPGSLCIVDLWENSLPCLSPRVSPTFAVATAKNRCDFFSFPFATNALEYFWRPPFNEERRGVLLFCSLIISADNYNNEEQKDQLHLKIMWSSMTTC